MLVLNADEIRALAPMARVIDCLEEAFRDGIGVAPLRQVIKMPGGAGDRLMLSMPAFHRDGGSVVKLVTVCPENPASELPAIHATIVVFSPAGAPIALLDGSTVTHIRTGATSALASKYLSREDSSHLAVVGTGALAPAMAEAHCAVRPISHISVWGRHQERAAAAAASIRSCVNREIEVRVSSSVEEAVSAADIVTCATSSATPLVAGKWLKPGVFVDLVGSFSPSKRESDDDVVRRSRLFVDTFDGALAEAGDLLDPLSRGVIQRERIEGELADLVRGRVRGRNSDAELTLFKSVGAALEDLATAYLVVSRAQGGVPMSARV